MPRVSVIIPLYNKANYINGSVKSVLQQTFRDFELIIVDDGSTDDGLAKVLTIKDPRILVVSQRNSGPGAARNRGLRISKGTYVTFLDADDTWHSDFLYTAVDRLMNNLDCDLFLCGAVWQPQQERRLPLLEEAKNAVSGQWKLSSHLTGRQAHDVMNFFSLGTVLLKRHVPILYGGFFDKERCTSGEDSYLWIQVMLNHTIFRELTCLVEINTEGSRLGIGRKESKPVPPALKHSEHLFRHSPKEYLPLLSRLLDFIAFLAIRRELYKMNVYEALLLYRKFPGLKYNRPSDFPEFPGALFKIPLQKILKRIRSKK